MMRPSRTHSSFTQVPPQLFELEAHLCAALVLGGGDDGLPARLEKPLLGVEAHMMVSAAFWKAAEGPESCVAGMDCSGWQGADHSR